MISNINWQFGTGSSNNNNNNKQLVERISQRLQGALQPKNNKYAKRAMINLELQKHKQGIKTIIKTAKYYIVKK